MTTSGYSVPQPASSSPWVAPRVDAPVQATVVVPGSKSLTNRKLVLAALSDGPSTLSQGELDRVASHFAPPAYAALPDEDAGFSAALGSTPAASLPHLRVSTVFVEKAGTFTHTSERPVAFHDSISCGRSASSVS